MQQVCCTISHNIHLDIVHDQEWAFIKINKHILVLMQHIQDYDSCIQLLISYILVFVPAP